MLCFCQRSRAIVTLHHADRTNWVMRQVSGGTLRKNAALSGGADLTAVVAWGDQTLQADAVTIQIVLCLLREIVLVGLERNLDVKS